MIIHFYKVRNCALENIDGRRVLIAPFETPLPFLTQYQFVRVEDGRWVHFPSEEETAYIEAHFNQEVLAFYEYTQPVAASAEEHSLKDNALIGFISLGVSLCVPVLAPVGWVLAVIMMLKIRAKHPKAKEGKILMWCLIGELIITACLIAIFVIFCDWISKCPD